jgi:hypothetical protein
VIDRLNISRCGNRFTGTHTLDWPHTNKIISSKWHSIDSMTEDQRAPEGTKTSPQKGAGREVIGIGGTRRDSSRSARLPKNTRWRGSSSISSLRRGAGSKR